MTRYIAILTLALSAALSADEAFAQDTDHVDEYGTIGFGYIVDEDPYLGYRILRKEGFTDQEARGVVLLVLHALHADTDELGIVIAIIADGGSEDLDCDGEYILGQANGKVAPSKHVLGQATGVGQSVY